MPTANPARPSTTVPIVARRTESVTRCTSSVIRTAPTMTGRPRGSSTIGRRREQQIDVEFLARAHQGVGFAVGERGHHLRALRRGVVLAHGRARWLWERVRVRKHLPGLVHHQHPSVDLLGVAFGLTGESVARHGCQR